MKRVWIWMLMLGAFTALADGPDDLYIQIYNSLQQADTLNQSGQYRSAADKYTEVQTALKKFQSTYPTWNDRIIRYRLNYVSERLESLAKFLQPVAPSVPTAAFQLSSKRKPEDPGQIQALTQEIKRLETEKTGLEAKLREALAVKPNDGSEQMIKAEEKIASLEKERDLLKVALEQAKNNPPESNAADARKLKELERERDDLQRRLEAQESRHQSELKQAEAKLHQLEQLNRDREELEKKLREALQFATAANGGKPTKSELKKIKKLEEEKAELIDKFNKASSDLAAMQGEREQRILAHQSALARIKELEKQRDDLQNALRLAGNVKPEEKEQLEKENLQLKSRLEAYEARPNPFTAEELALFKKPDEPTLPKSFVVSTKMTKDLPSRAKTLVAEADKDFAALRFEDAQKKYEEVLNESKTNVYALANLASTQIELRKTDEAEQNLKRALDLDTNDAFSLLLLGKIKLGENKFDEAFDALSRSAQVNPNSAETQNYLGIVLSEKGQRVSAEAALRRAIQIQPDYASAHHNLAIIYATQKPPFMELARWHYQKALSLGHSKNGDLEKMLAGTE